METQNHILHTIAEVYEHAKSTTSSKKPPWKRSYRAKSPTQEQYCREETME